MRLFKVKQNSDLVECKKVEFKSEHQEQTLESWLESSHGSFIADEKLEYALKEMDLPFVGVSDFIDEQIKSALEKYAEWKEQTEENPKRS